MTRGKHDQPKLWSYTDLLREQANRPPILAPVFHVDEQGREWEVVLLVRSLDSYEQLTDRAKIWSATHRGFRHGEFRRIYRFLHHDSRDTSPDTIRGQFEQSHRGISHQDHAIKMAPERERIREEAEERRFQREQQRGIRRRT